MVWQQPKTDWKESDYFNVEDYNRIKGNLNELHRMALVYWEEFPWDEMGEDKTWEDYGFYSDEINCFESNVEHICGGTYPFPVGERKVFYDNQPFIDWKELNRVESACLMIYENIRNVINGRRRLAFKLGRREVPC